MKDTSYFSNISSRIEQLLFHTINKHNKVLPVFFIVKYPTTYTYCSRTDISNLFDKLTTFYIRKGCDPYYIWKREQHLSTHFHYHCILFLDGNKIQYLNGIFETVERFWASTLNIDSGKGYIDYCLTDWMGNRSNNGVMLRRNDPDLDMKINQFLYAAQYLAKTYSSGYVNDGYRNFGCSRIR